MLIEQFADHVDKALLLITDSTKKSRVWYGPTERRCTVIRANKALGVIPEVTAGDRSIRAHFYFNTSPDQVA